MSTPTPAPTGLLQVAIATHHVAALTAFYRDVVGLKHLFDAGPNLAFFDVGGVRLMISVPSSPELDHRASILYYRVADIDSAHAAIKARGAREVVPPRLTARMADHELWSSAFRDPDDNIFQLMCEKR